jgi:hypothetical protein
VSTSASPDLPAGGFSLAIVRRLNPKSQPTAGLSALSSLEGADQGPRTGVMFTTRQPQTALMFPVVLPPQTTHGSRVRFSVAGAATPTTIVGVHIAVV